MPSAEVEAAELLEEIVDRVSQKFSQETKIWAERTWFRVLLVCKGRVVKELDVCHRELGIWGSAHPSPPCNSRTESWELPVPTGLQNCLPGQLYYVHDLKLVGTSKPQSHSCVNLLKSRTLSFWLNFILGKTVKAENLSRKQLFIPIVSVHQFQVQFDR